MVYLSRPYPFKFLKAVFHGAQDSCIPDIPENVGVFSPMPYNFLSW